jgi:hypothetical protein
MEEKLILKLNFDGDVIEHDFSYMKILEFTKPNVVFHRNDKSYLLDKTEVFFEDDDTTIITKITFKETK